MVLDSLRGLLGVLVLLIICYAVSEHRKRIDWKLVGTGLLLQFIFALLVLKVPMVKSMFEGIASIFVVFLDFTKEGSRFLFGKEMIDNIPTHGYIFAFQVLPTVLFFSAFTSLMYYLGWGGWDEGGGVFVAGRGRVGAMGFGACTGGRACCGTRRSCRG